MESIGFKEWAVVCEALGRGEQCVILRKGGIAEGRDGFAFRHKEFFLFPTFFHEQIGKTRLADAELPSRNEKEIEIRFSAKAELTSLITSLETALALAPLHVLQSDVIRERFEADGAGAIHVALVRIFRLAPRWMFPDAPSYGGCRSWVPLPAFPEGTRLAPVLGDDEFARRKEEFQSMLSASTKSASSASAGRS